MTARTINIISGTAMRAALLAAVVAITLLAGAQFNGKASAAEGTVEAVFGNVVAVNVPDSITVATSSDVVKLTFDSDTTLSGQGIESITDVVEGDRVIATAFRQGDGSLIAGRVLVQPVLSKPVTKHIFGVVVEVEPGVVIVQDRAGNVVTLDITTGIDLPEVGEAITVVALLDRNTGRLEVSAFQRVSDTVQRIEEAAEAAIGNDDRERLAEAAEAARERHLSILEQARVALEQARAALASAQGDAARAESRLLQVQAQYERIRQQYEQLAAANDRPAPNARLTGILTYRDDQWSLREGTFVLAQRGAATSASSGVEFRFTPDTQVVFTVTSNSDVAGSNSTAVAGVAYRYTEPAPLSDVKGMIESGSAVIVVYNPDRRPLTALQIIVLPRELDKQVSDAIAGERMRTFQGVITLVEQDVDIDDAEGVVIVASDSRGVKVATIVTSETVITVDGSAGTISDLVAGHVVNVVFQAIESDVENASTAVRGRFRAASIDARSSADEDEVGIAGVIREIDAAARVLAIVTRDGPIKAAVPETSRILLNGQTARFSELSVGDLVLDGTRYNRRTGEITVLVASSPREQAVRGTIVGLAVDPARVVISTGGGGVVTLVINNETKLVTEDGRPLDLRDLAVGQLVVKGSYEIAQRDSGSYLVAKTLVIAEPNVIVATGFVREVDASTPLLHVFVTRSTSGSTESLSLSVSDRSVIFKNGQQIKSIEPIEAGDIVNSVAYSPATNIILKLSVSSPNLVQIRGTVAQVIDLESVVILSSNGRRIQLGVSSTTNLTLNGRELESLRGVEVGDTVTDATYIASSNDRTAGRALSIALARRQASISPTDPTVTPSVETTVTGVIDGYEPRQWIAISGRRYVITSNTRFEGANPRVGLVARASLRLSSEGVFMVVAVSVASSPNDESVTRPGDTDTDSSNDGSTSDANTTVRISGDVSLLSTLVVVVDGTRITINRDTKIDGTLAIGSTVTVVAHRSSTGVLAAVEIVVEKSDRDDSDDDPESTGSSEGDPDGTNADQGADGASDASNATSA